MAEITTVTLCCALLAGVSLFILQLVCNAVPQPFIDEFFHIPQAQKYCIGSFSEVSILTRFLFSTNAISM